MLVVQFPIIVVLVLDTVVSPLNISADAEKLSHTFHFGSCELKRLCLKLT